MELSSYIASLSSFWSESDSGSRSVIVTLSLVVLWYAWLYYNRPDSNSRLPPGPRGLPLVGNLLSLDPELHSYFAGLAHTYGPIYKLRLGTKLGIVITSPSLARQVLKDHDVTFANRDVPAAGRAVTYGGSDIVWTRTARSGGCCGRSACSRCSATPRSTRSTSCGGGRSGRRSGSSTVGSGLRWTWGSRCS
ncbi:hypothetical protein ACLB2K_051181 [Fragaria x ananassa]